MYKYASIHKHLSETIICPEVPYTLYTKQFTLIQGDYFILYRTTLVISKTIKVFQIIIFK